MNKFIYIKAKLSNTGIFYKFFNLSMIVTCSNVLQKSKVDVKLSILLFLFLYAKLTRSHFYRNESLPTSCGLWYSRLFWVFDYINNDQSAGAEIIQLYII